MISELKSMKWNERIAFILAMLGGVSGIIGGLVIISGNSFKTSLEFMLVGLVLVGVAVAFLPPPRMWCKR